MDKKPSQADLLYKLLEDGLPHRTDEIQARVYGGSHLGLARVGARIYDIKKKYSVNFEGWKDKDNPALYWYQLTPKKVVVLDPVKSIYKPEAWAKINNAQMSLI